MPKGKPGVMFQTIAEGSADDFSPAKKSTMKALFASIASVAVTDVTVVITDGVYNSSVNSEAELDLLSTLPETTLITGRPVKTKEGKPTVIVSVTITTKDNATATEVSRDLVAATDTLSKARAFLGSVGVSTSQTPTVVEMPGTTAGDIVQQTSTDDPSGFAVLPGHNRLIPIWQYLRWLLIKKTWRGTRYADKEIPVHSRDPMSMDCKALSKLLAGGLMEPVDTTLVSDTVPLMRQALNCDGTVHHKGDGKPMKRSAIAHPDITPEA